MLHSPEGCALEHVRDARVCVRVVARVGRDLRPEEGRQILVHDDRLQGGDDSTSGSLKNVLVIPVRIDFPHSVSLQ